MTKLWLAVALLLILASAAGLLWSVADSTEIPKQAQILTISTATQEATWQPPRGKLYSLLLGTPASEQPLHTLSGSVRILRNGKLLFDQPFASKDLSSANWLSRQGRSSVIIDWRDRASDKTLENILTLGGPLAIQLRLDQPPASPVELWCAWLHSPSIERDVKAQRRAAGR